MTSPIEDMRHILRGKEVVSVSRKEYFEWYKAFENRRVDLTDHDGVEISTVFVTVPLEIDDKVYWFETKVFGGEHDDYLMRYETYDDAVEGHKKIVEMVKGTPK